MSKLFHAEYKAGSFIAEDIAGAVESFFCEHQKDFEDLETEYAASGGNDIVRLTVADGDEQFARNAFKDAHNHGRHDTVRPCKFEVR